MENIKILNFDDGTGNYEPFLVVAETFKDNQEIIKKAEELAEKFNKENREEWVLEDILDELERLNYLKVISYDVINLAI